MHRFSDGENCLTTAVTFQGEATEGGQEETVAVAVEEVVVDGIEGAGDGGLVEGEAEEAAPTIPLESIVVNEEYEGVVNNVVTYGAFVDIGTEVSYEALCAVLVSF